MIYTNLQYSGMSQDYHFSYDVQPDLAALFYKPVKKLSASASKSKIYQKKVCEFSCEIVSHLFNVPCQKLHHPTRSNAATALARQVAMYAAHVGFSLPQKVVGDYFERDRTTVAHACRLVEDLRDKAEFDEMIQRVEFIIKTARRSFEDFLQATKIEGPHHDG